MYKTMIFTHYLNISSVNEWVYDCFRSIHYDNYIAMCEGYIEISKYQTLMALSQLKWISSIIKSTDAGWYHVRFLSENNFWSLISFYMELVMPIVNSNICHSLNL